MIQRTIRKYVIDSLNLYPVIVITGARKVGKSIIAESLMEEYEFYEKSNFLI